MPKNQIKEFPFVCAISDKVYLSCIGKNKIAKVVLRKESPVIDSEEGRKEYF
jgi:hypothetical protein